MVLGRPQPSLCAVPSIGGEGDPPPDWDRGAPVRRPGETRRGAANLSCSPNNCNDVCPQSHVGVVKLCCGGHGAPGRVQCPKVC